MDWQKQFEEWFDKQDDNSELSFDTKSFMACYKAARKATLEEVRDKIIPPNTYQIEEVQKMIEELK